MRETIHVAVKEPQYVVDTNVTFAQVPDWFGNTTKDLKMDIIYPKQGKKKSPCIVWICGGAWLQLSRSAHLAYLSELARSGFVVASVQYRTSNEIIFPGQLMDIKSGIRYLRAHADRYCIDVNQFGVMGESAGGHLAAMAALTGDLKEYDQGWYTEYSSAVQAACPWYVPADMSKFPSSDRATQAASPESLLLGKNVADHMEDAMKACPVSYVTEQAPPFLLLHGLCDRTVPFSQSVALYEELDKKGVDVRLVGIEEADHADIQFFQREVWDMLREFFTERLLKED